MAIIEEYYRDLIAGGVNCRSSKLAKLLERGELREDMTRDEIEEVVFRVKHNILEYQRLVLGENADLDDDRLVELRERMTDDELKEVVSDLQLSSEIVENHADYLESLRRGDFG